MTIHESNRDSGTLAGKVWLSLMGGGLIMAGGFFCWWLWAVWDKAREMDPWVSVPAKVISSEIQTYRYSDISSPEFYPAIRYRYQFAGQDYDSETLRRVPIRSRHQDKAEKWVKRFPTGRECEAYVDPGAPESSVLKKDSKAALYAIWFPALFVVGGFGMILSAIRSGSPRHTVPD